MIFPFAALSGRLKQAALDAGDQWDPEWEKRLLPTIRKGLGEAVIANRHYWLDMEIPETVRRSTPKVGRNDPCSCGSGKKYKNCCGRV